jgi:dihydroorotase
MTILLKNGSVMHEKADVLIENGVIKTIAPSISEFADRIIDCEGLTILPGICDMHVHLRDPGQTHKEDLVSGTNAAAAGGVTAVLCMPNTTPALDTPEKIRALVARCAGLKARVYPCAAISRGLGGRELTDFSALKAAGAVAVSDDGMPVASDELMREAMLSAKESGLTIISHCEPENEMTARDIRLCGEHGLPVHIAHVSTQVSLGYIAEAKAQKLPVSCEIAPHHFTLTEDELSARDADFKMNPPLRGQEDVSALIDSVPKIADCIASDHAPHTVSEKLDFDCAPNGVLGLETILAVTLTRLYHTGKADLARITELLCVNPRKILGIDAVEVREGAVADIAVVDLNEQWVVEPEKLQSKSRNTCFKGMKLKGKVKYTLLGGEVVYVG